MVKVKLFKAMIELSVTINSVQQSKPSAWMKEIIAYKEHEILPEDKKQVKVVQWLANQFCLINDELYTITFSMPYLLCVNDDEAHIILQEMHEGHCGHHLGGKALTQKALRLVYFWLTMEEDAKNYVQKCKAC